MKKHGTHVVLILEIIVICVLHAIKLNSTPPSDQLTIDQQNKTYNHVVLFNQLANAE